MSCRIGDRDDIVSLKLLFMVLWDAAGDLTAFLLPGLALLSDLCRVTSVFFDGRWNF